MRIKLVSSTLALLLVLPHLFAGESAPAVTFAVAAKYPALTLAGRVCGEVVVSVTIDSAGSVKGTNVIEGHPMLRESAVNAASQWKFEESSLEKRVAILKFNFVILPEAPEAKSQTIFTPPYGIEIRQRPVSPLLQDQGDEPVSAQQPISRA